MTGHYISLVADYGGRSGNADLAFAEVGQKLYEKIDDIRHFEQLSVNAFNTVATGFVVAELALNSKIDNHIVYHNTAPRKDDINPRANNAGEFLAYCHLPNGVNVIGVFSGYCFSFLKGYAPIYKVKCESKGSQFRSRDVFPDMVASLAKHDFSSGKVWEFQGEELTNVPDMPENILLFTDGYGNLKTNIVLTEEQAKQSKLHVNIHDYTTIVNLGAGIFSVADGEYVLAKGSSGWILPNGERKFVFEISRRGGNAAGHFNFPKPGAKIHLQTLA